MICNNKNREMHLGVRYQSYAKLETSLSDYCKRTRTRYYKRDCRTIQNKLVQLRTNAISTNPKLIYSKIKYVCTHSSDGKIINTKGNFKKRTRFKELECPAYFFFRVTSCRRFLELVAMNTIHNHDKTYMTKKTREDIFNDSLDTFPIININNDNVEEVDAEAIDLDYLVKEEDLDMDGNNEVEYIRLTFENVDDELSYAEIDQLDSSTNDSVKSEASGRTHDDLKINLQSIAASFNYSGLIAPVFTPFKNDTKKSLNIEVIPKYIKFLNDKGIRGILVNGTSGEGTAMSVNERKIVAEKFISCARNYKMHVMIQVGGAPLPDVLELATHAEEFAADSILCLPELYMKPTINSHLINYLKIVYEAAPNTPLFYYHIPMFSNVTLHMGNFLNEIKNEIPTFSGIKFTSNALDEGIDSAKANRGSFAVFLGNDKLMLGAYALGLNSSIATTLNIFPQLGIKILDNFKNNDFANAKESQENLSAIVDVITKYGGWVSTMKEAMNILTPINCGPVRNPLPAISAKDAKEMYLLLEKYKYLL